MSLWLAGGYGPDMDGNGTGICVLRSREDGTLENLGVAVEAESPSYLVARGDHVYAVAEGAGRVHSYRRDGARIVEDGSGLFGQGSGLAGDASGPAKDGFALVEDGSASSGGVWPCHLSLLDSALVVANYNDGPLGVVSLREDGSVDKLVQSLPGTGSGPREEQQGPHAHASLRVDAALMNDELVDDVQVDAERVDAAALVSLDLGSDDLHVHRADGPRLTRTGSSTLPAGSGPRDIARHPSGLFFVLGELSNEMFVLEWTGERLELVASVAVPGAQPGDHGSGISFGPGGFVYAGIRGSGRIGVLRASADARQLEAIGSVSSEGDWPRHHAIDGDLLHVTNQQSNSIATFLLGADGMPALVGHTELPSPSFLLWIE